MTVHPTKPPASCIALLPGFDFADSYCVEAAPDLDVPTAVKKIFSSQPSWTRFLLELRNRVVSTVGLKPAPATGFPVISQDPAHVLLGFDDRHLDFRISILRDQGSTAAARLTVTTLVRTHNLFGRLYLRFVLPFHRIIVPKMLALL